MPATLFGIFNVGYQAQILVVAAVAQAQDQLAVVLLGVVPVPLVRTIFLGMAAPPLAPLAG